MGREGGSKTAVKPDITFSASFVAKPAHVGNTASQLSYKLTLVNLFPTGTFLVGNVLLLVNIWNKLAALCDCVGVFLKEICFQKYSFISKIKNPIIINTVTGFHLFYLLH